jgi:hypothetical protein
MTAGRTAVVAAPDASSACARLRADDPWRAARSAVELACALFEAQVVALFGVAGERLTLRASHGLTQDVLDLVSDVWSCERAVLAAGQPRGSAKLPALMLPCGDERGLAGLAYIEGPGVHRPSNLPLLVPLTQVLARVLRDAGAHDAAPRVDGQEATGNADAAELYVVMERHEWNVARVARLIGVTRMTVYNRLRRAGLTRKRVAKAPRRRRRPPRPAPPDADTPMAS